MKKSKFLLFIILITFCIVSIGCGKKTIDGYRIAIVPKALDSEFWQKLKQGAEDAAKDYPDVKLSVLAPTREINIDQQVNILEDQILKRVSALVVAPCGVAEIIPALERALASGRPSVLDVIIDTSWESLEPSVKLRVKDRY